MYIPAYSKILITLSPSREEPGIELETFVKIYDPESEKLTLEVYDPSSIERIFLLLSEENSSEHHVSFIVEPSQGIKELSVGWRGFHFFFLVLEPTLKPILTVDEYLKQLSRIRTKEAQHIVSGTKPSLAKLNIICDPGFRLRTGVEI